MKEKSLLNFIIRWVITIGIWGWAVCILINNPYKPYYQRALPLSYQEAKIMPNAAGYPPGDDIPIAKSIDDILNNKYITIQVDKSNIKSTRNFRIKDMSEAGHQSATVGSKYVGSRVNEVYSNGFSILGDILYATRQLKWNLYNTSYGEWCIVTLESGENVRVFVDLKLLDITSEKQVKLPIGTISSQSQLGRVNKENAIFWYVDMVGKWEDKEIGDISVFTKGLLIIFWGIVLNITMECISKSR